MKKRFLLIVLCLTICVVGLPFTASAAEIIGDSIMPSDTDIHMARSANCNCGVAYDLVNYSATYEKVRIYSTRDKCHERMYPVVRGQCPICHVFADFYNVYETITRHTFRYELINGIIYEKCSVCGYIQNS